MRGRGTILVVVAALGITLAVPVGASTSVDLHAKITGFDVRKCANTERKKRGLPKLESLRPLNLASRYHARNLASRGFEGDNPHIDHEGKNPDDRVEMFEAPGESISGVHENIALGWPTMRSACRAWMGSRVHRENILNPQAKYVGGAFVRGEHGRWFVQMFAERRRR